jgi:predicted short-subunit dehydrogenase-like oxidoreductase (DUF2520 family)
MNDIAIVGRGRMGTALSRALGTTPPLGRGADPVGARAVLLCVPDAEIAHAAAAVTPGPLVGHCSGATTLEPLAGHHAFSLHPLMTVTAAGARFEGAGAAIAGSTAEALAFARDLATTLGMRPVEIPDEDRAAYHAAASMASNFLVTLEGVAERVFGPGRRDLLVPLVRATVENWAELGPEQALTGPIARGDEVTVARQRRAVVDRAPDLTDVFDVLAQATREMIARGGEAADGEAPGGEAPGGEAAGGDGAGGDADGERAA